MPLWLLPALSGVFGFLKKYWVYFLIAAVAGGLILYGRSCYKTKIEIQDFKETIKRERKEREVVDRVNKVRRELEDSRSNEPNNDERDSCLLSNNPTEKDCSPKQTRD